VWVEKRPPPPLFFFPEEFGFLLVKITKNFL
jgi:hypothetical protein